MWLAVAAVFFLCILGIGAIRWGIQKKEPAPSEDLSATVKTMPVPEPSLPVKPEVLPDTPKTQTNKTQPVSKPISIPVPPPPKQLDAPLQAKALQIVKEYKLSGNRGTIESYFNRIYANQLTQGYQAQWATETLHKSTYIVKYRLIKPRMEPIVYVFQVDASAGKLTGALNNITLDLVGKI